MSCNLLWKWEISFARRELLSVLLAVPRYQRWGEPRQTTDVDATLLVEFGRELDVVRHLLKTYSSRIENAESFALQNRIVLLQSSQGIGIDLY